MTKRGCVLRQSDSGWSIAIASATESSNDADWHSVSTSSRSLADAVADFVAEHQLSHSVFLALDSKSVLPAKFSVSNSSELRDRRALSYRLEELLPVAAEDFEAHFFVDGNDVLGVATPTKELIPLLTALDERGLHVQSISPTALIGMDSLLGEKHRPTGELIVWQNEDAIDVFRVGQRIGSWWNLPSEAEPLQRLMASLLVRKRSTLSVSLLNASDEIRNALHNMPQIEAQSIDTLRLAEHARRGAAKVLGGRINASCELRQDKLITGDRHRDLRTDMRWLQWSLAGLLLVAAFFFWMRSRQYDNMVLTATEGQRTLFQEVFPDSRVPSAIVSRLKSEKAKLAGASGSGAAIEQPESALTVLYDLLAALPETLRVQVQQLRIEDGEIYLDVNTRSVGIASELADAFEKSGFSIEPPTTEQLDAKQVAVRINGRMSTVKQPNRERLFRDGESQP